MNPLAKLKAFAATRNGKITLGGGAAASAVGLGLYSRHRAAAGAASAQAAGGGATAASSSTYPVPSYVTAAAGTAPGANAGVADPVNTNGSGFDPGQFTDLLTQITRGNDLLEEKLSDTTATPIPATPYPYNPAPSPTPAPAPTPAPPPAAAPTPPPAPSARTYTVKSGDTLSAIAQRYYGAASKWPTIYDANRATIGTNPNLIKPGQVLVIP